MNFKQLALTPKVQQAITREGYSQPTPIQAQAITPQLEGKDVFGIAQTGTGKTAAFALPLLTKLSKDTTPASSKHCKSLILAPTRELAAQIAEAIQTYGQFTDIKVAVIFGGVGQNPQVKALRGGVDVLVATPGRLLDLKNQGHVKFSQVQTFILDEADRMLDMGFIPDIKKVLASVPKERQTVFFSATNPQSISRFAKQILTDPVYIEIEPEQTAAETVEQKLVFVQQNRKNSLLLHLLEKDHLESVLVFTRTKYKADKVAKVIKKAGIKSVSIHGDKSQNKRTRALDSFHKGKVRVLVGTDIAARGIDVDDISHVINYDLPDEAENYVHRIGRTGRAKSSGVAYSFCASSEKKKLKAIERVLGHRLPVVKFDDFDPSDDKHSDPKQKFSKKHRHKKKKNYRDKRKSR